MATESAPPPPRLTSLDAYRGLIMLFMASAGFGIPQVAEQFPDSAVWKFLAFHTSHAPWIGGGAWDMIQPAFMFMVGVAMPYSLARRVRDGQPWGRQLFHTVWRSLVLVALAVFLASKNAKQTTFIFTNVLGQIGLGYTFVFLLAHRGWKVQLGALVAIAVLSWAAFVQHPLPPADYAYTQLGVKAAELPEVVLPGFFAHWNKNANFAFAFDQWFLNLFPAERPYRFNAGGYTTLNFVPSLITMILGLMVGERLRADGDLRAKFVWMLKVAAVCIVSGLLLGWFACPIVKRIWTPSWALYSGGIVLGILAALFWIVEMCGWKKWTFPLVVVGMNSIAMYLLDQLLPGWITATLKTHLGQDIYSGPYGMIWQRCSVLLVLWLVCWWMYRRKIFLRI
jgi:heparan-alpha-glucosaminide N-acetyltransferase